ncbi:MAG: hemerythrin domain-containing protein [Tannerella sp.]|jgi:regulator of cell morphogenesis and NO signaling|nr:hemerythrin domain-containing protein [Tannerella sp.]
MDKIIFSDKMKLADLILGNYNLIFMLPRLGIPLGFGDKSVAEVCMKYNVPVDFFLLICNVYTFDSYVPDKEEVVATDMRLLIPYLTASHDFYLKERLPHIEQHLDRIVDKAEKKYGTVLKRFFDEYKNEVSEHFIYEEKTVFPYMQALVSEKPDGTYHIKDYERAHSNIEDKLNDLLQIIFKYFPGDTSSIDSVEVVYDIFQLSSDLNKHSLIEEKILVPYVESLEKRQI